MDDAIMTITFNNGGRVMHIRPSVVWWALVQWMACRCLRLQTKILTTDNPKLVCVCLVSYTSELCCKLWCCIRYLVILGRLIAGYDCDNFTNSIRFYNFHYISAAILLIILLEYFCQFKEHINHQLLQLGNLGKIYYWTVPVPLRVRGGRRILIHI